MIYRIEAEAEAREVYVVEADSENEARRLFNAGEAGQPEVAEVTGAEIVKVEEIEL